MVIPIVGAENPYPDVLPCSSHEVPAMKQRRWLLIKMKPHRRITKELLVGKLGHCIGRAVARRAMPLHRYFRPSLESSNQGIIEVSHSAMLRTSSYCRVCIAVWIIAIPRTFLASEVVWDMHATGSSASFRGLVSVDDEVIWACGSQGTVLRSVDGGQHWETIRLPGMEKVELRAIHAWDAQEAIVATAGQPCVILKTVDGGVSWREVYRNVRPESFIDGMKFLNDRDGFVVGDPVDGQWMLLRSYDRGESWQAAARESVQAVEGEAAFAASNSSIAWLSWNDLLIGLGGGEGIAKVLASMDGGATWVRRDVACMQRNASSGVFSLANRGPDVVAVGGDYLKPERAKDHVAISSDGGQSWRIPSGTLPRGFRSSVAYAERDGRPFWVTLGPTGSEWSHDGEEWIPISEAPFHALTVTPTGRIWAIGNTGEIGNLKFLKR